MERPDSSFRKGNLEMKPVGSDVEEVAKKFLQLYGETIKEQEGLPSSRKAFGEVRDEIAGRLGYRNYYAMPGEVKTYISRQAAKAKREYTAGTQKDKMAALLEQMAKDYERLYATDPSFRHAKTHPDDEEVAH